MRTKRKSESVELKRKGTLERSTKARAGRAVKAAECVLVVAAESPNGSLQAVSKPGRQGLLLADALKSKAKGRAFAKQQLKEARVVVLDRLPTIVKALSAKSAKSYLTAKFLFDFAELEKISVETGTPGRPSSLKAILKKLGCEDRRGGDRIVESEGKSKG